MFMKKHSGTVAVLGLMLFMVLAFRSNNIKVQGSYPLNSLWVAPSAVAFSTGNATLATKFNVTVWAYMDNATYLWQINMTFNPAILQVTNAGLTGVGKSEFFSSHTVTVPGSPIIDNSLGCVLLGESLLGTDYQPSATDTLAFVEFQVAKLPNATVTPLTCGLGINDSDTYFQDLDGNDMLTTLNDGAYSIAYTVPPPLAIATPTQVPAANNVNANANVTVSANVTGGDGGVHNVTLYYSTDNVTFAGVSAMTLNTTTGLYGGLIPGYSNGTKVYYKILAYDGAGNSVVKNNNTQNYSYPVVSESISLILMMMVLATMSTAVLLMRKKIVRK